MKEIEETLGISIEMTRDKMIGCSIGITSSDTFTEVNQLDEMISYADESLYEVKEAGKGTYIFA